MSGYWDDRINERLKVRFGTEHPGKDSICTICGFPYYNEHVYKKKGDHYEFCCRNPNPLSIYRRIILE
jgi:hypothetical protein